MSFVTNSICKQSVPPIDYTTIIPTPSIDPIVPASPEARSPFTTIPPSVLEYIFDFTGTNSTQALVCKGFNQCQRSLRRSQAQRLCNMNASTELLNAFGIPCPQKITDQNWVDFWQRIFSRISQMYTGLPEDIRPVTSVQYLMLNPEMLKNFLQKAYDHSLRLFLGVFAKVPPHATLKESTCLIKEWLSNTDRPKVSQLYFRKQNVFCLPKEVCTLTNLTHLIVNDTKIATLPSEIGNLGALTHLDLSNNQLAILPPEIGNLGALTNLCLGFNKLAILPPEIGNLGALTDLSLQCNTLTALPSEIGKLSALRELVLHINQLTALPPEIGNLGALTYLNLSHNQLAILPPEIGKLRELSRLELYGNQITSLPPEIRNLKAQGYQLEVFRSPMTAGNPLGTPSKSCGHGAGWGIRSCVVL